MRLYMTELTCRSCQGYRLNPQALAKNQWHAHW